MGVRSTSKPSYDPIEEILKAYAKFKGKPLEELTSRDRVAAEVAYKYDEHVLRQATVMHRQWKTPIK